MDIKAHQHSAGAASRQPEAIGKSRAGHTSKYLSQFSPSCFLIEGKEGAGLDGPLIEGDMLVVDEGHTPQHNDLVIALVVEEQHLSISSGSVARYC